MKIKVTTFYHFADLTAERVQELDRLLIQAAANEDIKGLIILGSEGINSTVSGTENGIQQFKNFLTSLPEFSSMIFKDSSAKTPPFKRFKVKIRSEIVTLDRDDIIPDGKNHHLSPSEWNEVLENEDVVLIDTRNDYEVKLGKFKGAIDPKLNMFNEFPEYVRNSGIPKDKKVLMYCTGGIRCEKAIYEMQQQGYQEVYQLDGGILKYIEEYPDRNFDGECFVFDHRVALNQKLEPSERFHLCPHCGNPGELVANCVQCDQTAKICKSCQELQKVALCSKNCAHHYTIRPKTKINLDAATSETTSQ